MTDTEFIPLAAVRDHGSHVAASIHARMLLRENIHPQRNAGPLFFVENLDGVYGVVRNLDYAGREQDTQWQHLQERFTCEHTH